MVVIRLYNDGLIFLCSDYIQKLYRSCCPSTFWRPFLLNLGQLKSYSVSSPGNLELIPSTIDEFTDLNVVLQDLTTRARKEYIGLKEFTENASHELQTPLTIIESRMESISQLDINEEIAYYLLDAKRSLDRLSRLNRGLLLLAKLEHDEFPDQQEVDLRQLVKSLAEQMEDLFEQRGMKLNLTLEAIMVPASPYLLEIMISNLIANMRFHGLPKTEVFIKLNDRGITFSNPGEPLAFSPERLFSRFGKTTKTHKGHGLGLSIVRQICINHKWEITYSYHAGNHVFGITFAAGTGE